MTSSPLSRRAVLRGLGGITVALPFLESLANPRKVARAGTSSKAGYNGRPKRFVAWVSMFGTLPQYHLVGHNGQELFFPDGSTHDTLDPVKQHLTFLNGVNMPSVYKAHGTDGGVGHSTSQCQVLTARVDRTVKHPWAPGGLNMPIPNDAPTDGDGYNSWSQCYPSIDQAIANRIDSTSKFRSIRLGDNLEHTEQLFYGEGEDVGNAIWNPVSMFQTMFSEFQGSQSAVEALRAQRKSVLDVVNERAKAFASRVSKRDQLVVQSHFDAIRDIEKGLEAVAACTIPGGLTSGFDGISDWPDFIAKGLGTKRYELFFKLLALALKCDLTRVAGIQFSANTASVPDIVPNFGSLSSNAADNAHNYSHAHWSDVSGTEIYRQILRWKNRMFADFVADLASASEGEHSVLDNTVVFHTSEMFTGNHENTPSQIYGYGNRTGDPSIYCQTKYTDQNSPARSKSLDMFYAGSAGGALKTGELFDFLDKSKGYNPDRYVAEFGHYSHGEVMLTMARAMGVGPEQLKTFGETDLCQGEIGEIMTGS